MRVLGLAVPSHVAPDCAASPRQTTRRSRSRFGSSEAGVAGLRSTSRRAVRVER